MVLGIYLPTYKRAHKLAKLAKNIEQNTNSDFKLYFCVEEDDRESILAAKDTGHEVIINEYGKSFSDALQSVYEQTNEPIFFWANDDFYFLKDWDVEPLKKLEAEPNIGVLGVHDGNPKTRFFSMSFVRRSYIEKYSGVVDMPNRVLYPYGHNYVDDELTLTAQARGMWDFCPHPCIEHQHPSFTWLGEFKADEVNKKNDATFAQDTETFNSRYGKITSGGV